MSESITTASPAPVAAPRKLSAELHALNQRFGQESVQLGEMLDLLDDRAYALMVVLLALPLFTPATLLGLAFAVGPMVTGLGLGLVFELHPSRLPLALRARRLPPRFFGLLLRGAEKVIRLLERISRKRLPFFVTGRWAHRLIGLGIVLAALLLMIPAPFSNGPPATAMVCLAMGLLEEDGGMVVVGILALIASVVFFGLIGFFGLEGGEHLWHWITAHFSQPTLVLPATP